jgi:hypothetical protein
MKEADKMDTHSPRTLEVAEILMSMGAVARNSTPLPEAKRSRRGSRY